MVETIFWISVFIIFYTYLGYGILLFVLIRIKRLFKHRNKSFLQNALPEVTVLVAAYNEADCIEEKIINTFGLEYPKDKIKYLFVTDGSNDGTVDIIKKFPTIELMHKPEREGKIKAVHRAMAQVKTPVVVFTDANSLLNKDAVLNIVRHYEDEKVGAVAGEKRILVEEKNNASSSGEGIYWKYESTLKKWDSELYSVVGAAGELFSIRTHLYEFIPDDTIIEDFFQTMKVAQKGYRVKYEPEAYAMEKASFSINEELKRKIRISAGGIQAIIRLAPLLNMFKYGILSFQYISHRVLRWSLTPICLPICFIGSLALSFHSLFYFIIFILQTVFYLMAAVGAILASKEVKSKAVFVPYYFFIMNYSVVAGFFRFIKGNQTVIWEKAKRA